LSWPIPRSPEENARQEILYEEYHPYGTSAYRSSNGSVDVSARRYRYTGKERDDETGLYYNGARYLAAWLGRWTSADPIGIGADGPGLYNYTRGSPVNYTDPSGTQGSPPTKFEEKREVAQPPGHETGQPSALGKTFDARAKGKAVGKEWGSFAGDVQNFLDTMKDTQGRLSKEERERDVERMLEQMEQLALPEETFETDAEQSAYAEGVSSGFGSKKFAAVAAVAGIALFHDIVAGGGLRGLRLPDAAKWGRWAGTPGNSKFLLNAAGLKHFNIPAGGVGWVRFTKGKADFSAVAHAIEGETKSLRVPALNNAVAKGTTAAQLRKADEAAVLAELSSKWGKTEAGVAKYIKDNNLRIHHYRDDLIQLVPKSYHSIAHEGTVKERLAKASLLSSILGMSSLTDQLLEQMAAYQGGNYGR
jgi:RHS repeat-associated protein